MASRLRAAWAVLVTLVLAGGVGRTAAAHPTDAPGCPTPLRVAFVDFDLHPFLRGQGDRFADPPGKMVDAIQKTLGTLRCPAQLMRLPVRRLVQALQDGDVELAIPLTPSPERMTQLRFPVDAQGRVDERFAIAETSIRLYATADHEADVAARLNAQGRGALRYGALRGSVYADVLVADGLRVELTPDVGKAWAMLRLDRFDVMALPQQLTPDAADGRLVGPPLFVQSFFVPANPDFAAANGPWLNRFWRQMCEQTRSNFHAPRPCPKEPAPQKP